jgi:hypothetical protein
MIRVDMVPVEDEEEAFSLALHHLQLAAMYFEASPTDLVARLEVLTDYSQPAMVEWAKRMELLYPADEEED